MKYRKFGSLDWKVSALGFGTMRLPVVNDDYSNINKDAAIKMIRYAIDHGVNYFDSAYGYHNGNSEVVVGSALKDGYREKVKIATKLPCWLVNSSNDFDRLFNEQLKRLETEKIDFYLLHGLNRMVWRKMYNLGVLKWAEGVIADGRIGGLGFSFHDNYTVFQEIIDAYSGWTLCQIQYNYMDEEFQAGTHGLKYAHQKGLAVVAMEPIRGGQLSRPPEIVTRLLNNASVKRTPQEWALRWVWNHPEVTLALSGMSTMKQVVENINFVEHSQPHNLTDNEVKLIGKVRDAYLSLTPVDCNGCQLCMPCPNGIELDIPRIFDFYKSAIIYNEAANRRKMYSDPEMFRPETRADKCNKCGQCVEKCPQKLPIPDLLEKAHLYLTEKA
ncbi:MAG: aldo/keto reductase [Dehalococcoidales bacterium]